MKWGFQCSGPREPIRTKFCRGGQVQTEMPHANFGGSRFIGLGAVGVQILGFPFKTYMAYNNFPSTSTMQACDTAL